MVCEDTNQGRSVKKPTPNLEPSNRSREGNLKPLAGNGEGFLFVFYLGRPTTQPLRPDRRWRVGRIHTQPILLNRHLLC